MKLILAILSTFIVSAVSEYVLQPIDGISGLAEAVEFDSFGNAYVVTADQDKNHQLFKLSPEKEILWAVDIPDTYYMLQIIINSQNTVYFNLETNSLDLYVSVLREDTLTIEKIDKIYFRASMFLDEEDNLFYDGYEGVKLLRPNSTTPILIQNLEEYNYLDDVNFGIDSKGDVYFGVTNRARTGIALAFVTKEAKQEESPIATYYPLDGGYFTDGLTIDENGDVWIFITDIWTKSKLKKFSNGNLVNILPNDPYENHKGKAVKDRVYVVSITWLHETAPTYFLTLDGEIHNITDLGEVGSDTFFGAKIMADTDGNTYIGADSPFDKGPVALIKPNEENATWITFPRLVHIRTMLVNENDDVWILTFGQGVYYLKKGETKAEKVLAHAGVDEDLWNVININKKTNDVFVLGRSALYFISSDSV